MFTKSTKMNRFSKLEVLNTKHGSHLRNEATVVWMLLVLQACKSTIRDRGWDFMDCSFWLLHVTMLAGWLASVFSDLFAFPTAHMLLSYFPAKSWSGIAAEALDFCPYESRGPYGLWPFHPYESRGTLWC